MKHSIRTRFTVIFMVLIAVIPISLWIINSFFLENFYISQKVKLLERAYEHLNEYVMERRAEGRGIGDDLENTYGDEEEQTEVSRLIRQMNEKYNTSIVVIDSENDETFPSFWDGQFLADLVQQYILGRSDSKTKTLITEENYKIQQRYDPHRNSYYLQNWGFFDDNRTIFIMSMPVASIRESVSLSNRFLAYVSLIVVAVGGVMMYFATRRLTSPIRSLARLSERMAELDFDAKYTGNSQDEIGALGKSMNIMAEKLKETIDELKSANNELQHDIAEKIRIDETRKEFIANVSHELKTPIALIQGYAEGLTEGMAEDADSRNYYCEVIMDEAGKMNKMVRQLLTLTALEFGNDRPQMEEFDLVGLIKGVLSSAGILIQQKEARVEFEDTGLVMVWADEFKIEEVVTNYLNNALNHLDGERKIAIRLQQNEHEVRVSVYNTGEHIPEEDIPMLWTKFFKVDKARTREYGGSGIGLSIVKAIIESHGKAYGVANTEGGVEFWFTLDLYRGQDADACQTGQEPL